MFAGGSAGAIAAGATNAFECVTVVVQTNPEAKITEIVKREGSSLLTKGIQARIYYNTM